MRYWLFVAGVLLTGFSAAGPAQADSGKSAPLTICNKSSAMIDVAVGYYSPGVNDPSDHSVLTGPFVSRGWTEIQPSNCRNFENPFGARYMFWYGYGQELNHSEIRAAFMRDHNWPTHFCVSNYFTGAGANVPGFNYEDANESVEACDGAGGNADPVAAHSTMWVTSRKVDTWVDATVNFSGCSDTNCDQQWSGDQKP